MIKLRQKEPTRVPYPNMIIDPKQKGRDWILLMNKAIKSDWDIASGGSFAKGIDKYRRNRRYSLGNQPEGQYKELFKNEDDENFSFMNIDWTVIPVINKFRRIAMERIGKIRLKAEATAIDPLAMADRKRYESDEKANIQLRTQLEAFGADTSILKSGEVDQPMNEAELQMKMDFSYKHNMAIDVEKGLEAVFYLNHLEEVREEVRRDIFECGVGIIRDWTDPLTGEVKFRRVDPSNAVISACKSKTFRDLTYAGEVIYMTIEELRREVGDSVPEEQLYNIAHKSIGKYGNGQWIGDSTPYNRGYDNYRVPVLDMQFATLDRVVKEKRINKRGNVQVGRVDWKYSDPSVQKEDRQYFNDDRVVWYESKWVMDTEILFSYGPTKDQKTKPSSSKLAPSPNFHLNAPDLFEMDTRSMVDDLISITDKIHIAWYKLQNVIAQARPKGILIEVGALEDVSVGDGGERFSAIQLLDLFNQTGNMIYRKTDQAGNMTNYKPIEELQGGLGTEASEYFSIIDRYFNMMRGMLGFNEVTDGSTPDARMLNGVAEMAQESTSNAIYHIIRAERNLFERLADSCAVRLHDTIALRKTTIYDDILGASGLKSFKEDKDRMHREYGIMVRDNDDPMEKERLDGDITIALEAGQITIADKHLILTIDNIKQRAQYLAYMVNKNNEKRLAEKQNDIQANAKAQQESNMISEQEKRKTAKIDSDTKIAVEMTKGDEARKTLKEEYKWKLQWQALVNQGKVQVEGQKGENASEVEEEKDDTSSLL